MHRGVAALVGCPIALLLGLAPGASAEEAELTDETLAIRREAGHQLLLPNDWPVVRQDGVLAPVPLEEYLSMKFGQVRGVTDRSDRRLNALDRRLARVEEQQRALLLGLKALEARVTRKEDDDGRQAEAR